MTTKATKTTDEKTLARGRPSPDQDRREGPNEGD